ncbi:MAG TPA: 4-hydroxythreonine-4-phosphate dehydrogenase PdxA, partial [Flavobacterium sp.]|nr:4-hydroxythreonine-4-phosphate dehydrogenase PdxA [Flavobacterium sp.]
LTDHVPVNDVAKYLNEELILEKIKIVNTTLNQDFSIVKPKIAVLGLNPHAGDNGVIGKEDEEIIKPALKNAYTNGIMVFGPFSADSFFGSNQYKQYDAVLAVYHDQGLIPFKTLSFGKGVNFTAGLSKVRTSPDHGTAFDIAGKNKASESSFREALYLAIDVYKNRTENKELTRNPLVVRK